jgi:hypothetical protein
MCRTLLLIFQGPPDDHVDPQATELLPLPENEDIQSSILWNQIVLRFLPTEKHYIDLLRLGRPLLCDNFQVFPDGEVPANTFCALFPHVLLLCRVQSVHTSYSSLYPNNLYPQPDVSLVYGYLYPRHIYSLQLNESKNGRLQVPPPLMLVILLVCEGTWGNNRHYLSLNLHPTRNVPELPEIWIQALQAFRQRGVLEIGTILDRLPLGQVSPYLLHLTLGICLGD